MKYKHNDDGERVESKDKFVQTFSEERNVRRTKPSMWVYQSVINKYFETSLRKPALHNSAKTKLDTDSSSTSTSPNPDEGRKGNLSVEVPLSANNAETSKDSLEYVNYGLKEMSVQVDFPEITKRACTGHRRNLATQFTN